MKDCNLVDLGFKGNPYTWARRRGDGTYIYERLDRFLACNLWKGFSKDIEVSHLSSPVSDHESILLSFEFAPRERRLQGKSHRFFFETMWAGFEECEPFESWVLGGMSNGSLLSIASKLQLTGLNLQNWSKRTLPIISKELKEL
ncbi:hypothetical protein RIF29_33854 [Crotalaria pallida]|uniref:Endonuclease/exonuclease/phosphatase domain-containing protein n=1 Tax=Crotalaria pallida TaxID=3830 RepID=A0AAN9HUB0_CROPI